MTLKKDGFISLLADPSRPFKEKAEGFLSWARDRLQARHAQLVLPYGPAQWTIFSLSGKGKVKIAERYSRSLDLKKAFKRDWMAGSGEEMGSPEKELSRFFPDVPFLAVPLAGKGKKVHAALGAVWKEGKKIGMGERKKLSDLAQGETALLLCQAWNVESLTRQNKNLSRIGSLKDDHYQMLVHDLKGPISEIISNVDLLKYNPRLSEDDREVVDTALCGCDSLHHMVADLLDIHKMEENAFPFCFQTCDLKAILETKIARMTALAAHKDIVFVPEIHPGLPPVKADAEILERVLANLFSNAIAHSYPGRPLTVGAEFLKEEGLVRVRVVDQGEGVPKSKQKKIFQKFGQGYKKGARKRYSTGLGLTFCRMAVENHGGKIWMESEEGQGSAFFFTLPLSP